MDYVKIKFPKKGIFDCLYKGFLKDRITKKGNFDRLCKWFLEGGITKKRNSDRLHKQVMWFSKSENGEIAYVSRSHDLLKKEIVDSLHKQFLEWIYQKRNLIAYK